MSLFSGSLDCSSSPRPQGDQLKQEAKGEMMALYNKLKNNCDGIKGDASVDELGTVYEDAEDDDLRKNIKNKERWVARTIQLENDFASYEGMVTVLASGELTSSASQYNEVRQLVEGTKYHVTSAMQVVEAEDRSRGLYAVQAAPASLLEYPKFSGRDVQ